MKVVCIIVLTLFAMVIMAEFSDGKLISSIFYLYNEFKRIIIY